MTGTISLSMIVGKIVMIYRNAGHSFIYAYQLVLSTCVTLILLKLYLNNLMIFLHIVVIIVSLQKQLYKARHKVKRSKTYVF